MEDKDKKQHARTHTRTHTRTHAEREIEQERETESERKRVCVREREREGRTQRREGGAGDEGERARDEDVIMANSPLLSYSCFYAAVCCNTVSHRKERGDRNLIAVNAPRIVEGGVTTTCNSTIEISPCTIIH